MYIGRRGAFAGMKLEEWHQKLHVHHSRSPTQQWHVKHAISVVMQLSIRIALDTVLAVLALVFVSLDGVVQHAT